MRRQTLIAGNWKMHKTIPEARELARALLAMKECFVPEVRVVVAPPFTALAAVARELGDQTQAALCAQTMHWADSGPFTGEISPLMLLDAGCTYVLLGHSERRAGADETDHTVNLKVHAAFAHGLIPIIAVGETLQEHESGQAKECVVRQTSGALFGLEESLVERCVIAYEPIWAIGTGMSEDPASADAVMGTIRSSHRALSNVQILYGGSVKPDNVAELVAQPNIDGALVGGASLDAAVFGKLLINARTSVAAG